MNGSSSPETRTTGPLPLFVFDEKEFLARAFFLFVAFSLTKDFALGRVLHVDIPGLNTLLLAGFACMAIATERARLLWDRTHLLLLCAVVAFACANTFAVNGESRRLTGALFRTIQPALATALFLYVDLPREKILKVMKWINLLILFCTFVALVESVLRTPQRPFAIYLIKPSPFCLLDELDAALDDSNIGRFVQALKDFLVQSQFLIITHNQHSIANSGIVYGVTMPEKGVSKIVSMRLPDIGVKDLEVGREEKLEDIAIPLKKKRRSRKADA